MKALYTLLLVMITAGWSFGQTSGNTINFCGQNYELPAAAKLVTPYQVQAEGLDITLMYVNPADLRNGGPADYSKQRMKKLKGKDLQEISCFIQDTPAKAFKFGYPTEKGMAYEMLAYGVTKGQPVIIELILDVDPYSNKEIPEFARQFVHFDK